MASSSSATVPVPPELLDLKDMTVGAIKESERKEYTAAVEARQRVAQAQASEKSWSKAASSLVKAEMERDKIVKKELQKAREESDEVKKKRLATMYNRYMESFPFLAAKIPKINSKTSLVELEEIITLVREEMDSQRSLVQLHKYLDFGFLSLESVWGDGAKMTFVPPPLRFNLKYHRRGIFRNELEPLLVEIDIEYPWLGRQSIILRAVEALSEVVMKTHLINTNPEARKVLGLETAPPKTVPGMEKL
jgi:hypothetical protein